MAMPADTDAEDAPQMPSSLDTSMLLARFGVHEVEAHRDGDEVLDEVLDVGLEQEPYVRASRDFRSPSDLMSPLASSSRVVGRQRRDAREDGDLLPDMPLADTALASAASFDSPACPHDDEQSSTWSEKKMHMLHSSEEIALAFLPEPEAHIELDDMVEASMDGDWR